MFTLYGISGPIFYEPLEDLTRVRALNRVRSARGLTQNRVEPGADGIYPVASLSGEDALQSYRSMLPNEIERGPLFHADQIMEHQVICVAEDEDVAHAWRTLRDNRIHQAPVLGIDAKLVGIVSERDLLTAFNIDNHSIVDTLKRQVRDVMTTPVVAANAATDIRRIAAVLLDHCVDGVPITSDDARLVGFISRGDILRSIVANPPLSLWR